MIILRPLLFLSCQKLVVVSTISDRALEQALQDMHEDTSESTCGQICREWSCTNQKYHAEMNGIVFTGMIPLAII